MTLDRIVAALPDWMRAELGPIALWQLAGVLVLVLVALVLRAAVVWLIGTWVHRLAGRVRAPWIDRVASRISRPVGGITVAVVFWFTFPWLRFPAGARDAAHVATRVLLVYSFVWLAYRLIDVLSDWLAHKAAATETKLDDQFVPLLRRLAKVFTVVIGGIFILQNLDVNVGSLLAGLGLGGLAFALAAKDSIANVFGSLVIFVDRPFQIGDAVVIGGVEGTVEEVGFRTTRIRTPHNSLVTLPNAQMTSVAIDNFGARRYRRYRTTLALTYDTPPAKLEAFCEGVRDVIRTLENMRKNGFIVEFESFGDSSLNVLLVCFVDTADPDVEMRTRTRLNLAILQLAERLGISFAFPTRTLHVEGAPAPLRPPPGP